MRKIILLLYLSVIQGVVAQAQLLVNQGDITINAGEILTIQGGYQADVGATLDNQGTIRMSGNWTNNSTNMGFVDTAGAGFVKFLGSGQLIEGTSSTRFNILLLDSALGNTTLQIPTEVKRKVNFGTRAINLNSNTLSILNKADTAIAYTGTGGFINNATNFDAKVIWKIDGEVGNYTVPFRASSGESIPVQLNITTNVPAYTGSFSFSTYATNHNNLPFPTGITHTPGNEPLKTLDRFWLVQPTGYADNPTANVILHYANIDTVSPNEIVPSSIDAYYWNGGDWASWSGINTAPNQITSYTIKNNFGIIALRSAFTPLPVRLLSIQARPLTHTILVNWQVASAADVKYFELERSENGRDFEKIAVIEQTTDYATRFEYDDATVLKQKLYYYRLRMYDVNGRFTYSPVVSARLEQQHERVFSVFPNPTHGKLSATIQPDAARTIEYKVYGYHGALTAVRKVQVAEKQTLIEIDLSQTNLAAGVYYLLLSDPLIEEPIKHKIILLQNQ